MQLHLGNPGLFIVGMMLPEHLWLPASVLGCCSEENRHDSASLITITESHYRCQLPWGLNSVKKMYQRLWEPVMLQWAQEILGKWCPSGDGGVCLSYFGKEEEEGLACAKTCPSKRSGGHLGRAKIGGIRGERRLCCKMNQRRRQGLWLLILCVNSARLCYPATCCWEGIL